MVTKCTMRLATVAGLLLLMTMSGCREQNPTASEVSAPKESAPSGPARPSEQVDWASVVALPSAQAKFSIKVLARKLDIWHAGRAASVVLTYSPGAVTDESGNSLTTPPEQWKGIVTEIRSKGNGEVVDWALKSSMYSQGWGSDDKGKVAAFAYKFKVISDDVISVSMVKKINDGL